MKALQVNPSTTPAAGRIGAARQAFEWAREIRSWYQEHTRWSVSISSTDRLYDVAHHWFTEASANVEPPRALSARLNRSKTAEPVAIGEAAAPCEGLELYYDVRHDRTVDIDGHTITVSLNRPESTPGGSSDDSYARMMQPDILYFHATSRAGQQAVIAMLERLATSQDRRKPALHMLASWGGWSRRDDLPQRALDGDLNKDTSLLNLISEVGSRSVLLLEDVDVFHAARQREDQNDGLSMAGFLNGVATPHGMISVLTTNDASVIDDALLRPGRVDRREVIGLPETRQIARLWARFYDMPIDRVDPDSIQFKGSTADASELFKMHDDHDGALEALYGFRS